MTNSYYLIINFPGMPRKKYLYADSASILLKYFGTCHGRPHSKPKVGITIEFIGTDEKSQTSDYGAPKAFMITQFVDESDTTQPITLVYMEST